MSRGGRERTRLDARPRGVPAAAQRDSSKNTATRPARTHRGAAPPLQAMADGSPRVRRHGLLQAAADAAGPARAGVLQAVGPAEDDARGEEGLQSLERGMQTAHDISPGETFLNTVSYAAMGKGTTRYRDDTVSIDPRPGSDWDSAFWATSAFHGMAPSADPSRAERLYGAAGTSLLDRAEIGRGEDLDSRERDYVTTRAVKGANRAAYGYASLKRLIAHLDGERRAIERVVAAIDTQVEFLTDQTRTKRAYKAQGKRARKARPWRWDNMAAIANTQAEKISQEEGEEAPEKVSGLALAMASRKRLQDRLDEITAELEQVRGVRGDREEAKTARRGAVEDVGLDEEQKGKHKQAHRAGKALGDLPRHYHARFDRDAVGSESMSVGLKGGVKQGEGAKAEGSLAIAYGHGKSVGDDRRFKVSNSIGIEAAGSGDVGPAARLAGSLGYEYSRTKVFEDPVHFAAHKVASSPETKDALRGLEQLGGGDEFRSVVQVGRDLADEAKDPNRVSTHGLTGKFSASLGQVSGVKGSITGKEHTFSKGKGRDKLKRRAQELSGTVGVRFGGFSADVTYLHMGGHAIGDNDGDYVTIALGMSRDLSAMGGSALEAVQEVESQIGLALSKYRPELDADKPRKGLKSQLGVLRNLVEGALRTAVAEGFDAAGLSPQESDNPFSGSAKVSFLEAMTLNYVNQGGTRWALQYKRHSEGMAAELGLAVADPTSGGFIGLDLALSQDFMKGERLGDQTLTYVQTVFNGLMARRSGEADWALFKEQHGDELESIYRNARPTNGETSKLRQEMEGARQKLGDKAEQARRHSGVAQVAGLEEPVARTLAALDQFLAEPNVGRMEIYLHEARMLDKAEAEVQAELNHMAMRQGDRARRVRTFMNGYFGGWGPDKGWMRARDFDRMTQ